MAHCHNFAHIYKTPPQLHQIWKVLFSGIKTQKTIVGSFLTKRGETRNKQRTNLRDIHSLASVTPWTNNKQKIRNRYISIIIQKLKGIFSLYRSKKLPSFPSHIEVCLRITRQRRTKSSLSLPSSNLLEKVKLEHKITIRRDYASSSSLYVWCFQH